MWGHWCMRANRLNSNQDDLLLKKFILISHNSPLSLSLLYTRMQTHAHTQMTLNKMPLNLAVACLLVVCVCSCWGDLWF